MRPVGCVSFGKKVRFDVKCCGGMVAPTPASTLSILTMRKPALSAVDAPEWQEIEMTVDSGACDTVVPTGMSPHISLLQNEFSKAGYEYEVANGAGLPNRGEKRCIMMTEDSTLGKRIVFQCADVHKALLSVSRCADLGYDCVLGKTGGQLRDTVTGDVIPLHRRGNLYVLKAWIKQDVDQPAGFTRQDGLAR